MSFTDRTGQTFWDSVTGKGSVVLSSSQGYDVRDRPYTIHTIFCDGQVVQVDENFGHPWQDYDRNVRVL